MCEIFNWCKDWNAWRKHSLNNWVHKLLVLLGIRKSPTFANYRNFKTDFIKNYKAEKARKD